MRTYRILDRHLIAGISYIVLSSRGVLADAGAFYRPANAWQRGGENVSNVASAPARGQQLRQRHIEPGANPSLDLVVQLLRQYASASVNRG